VNAGGGGGAVGADGGGRSEGVDITGSDWGSGVGGGGGSTGTTILPPTAAAPTGSAASDHPRLVVSSTTQQGLMSLPTALGSYSRSVLFVALTVLPPYLMARCSRGGGSRSGCTGGWDELHSIFSPLWSSLSSSSTTTMIQYDNNGPSSSSSHASSASGEEDRGGANDGRNVESLRGQSRRDAFEERRKRMVQMACRIERSGRATNSSEEEEESAGNDDDGAAAGQDSTADDSSNDDEHEDNTSLDGHSDGEVRHQARVPTSDVGVARITRLRTKYFAILQRLCSNGADFFRQAHLATLMLPTPAHSIQRSLDGNDNHLLDGLHHTAAANSKVSLIKWILRLNLALFYLNGKYPTIAHRLTGVLLVTAASATTDEPRNGQVNETSGARGLAGAVSPSLSDRPSYRIVGALILLEAGAALSSSVNRVLVEIAHRWQMRRSAARSAISASTSSSTDQRSGVAAAERERILHAVERAAPSVLTYDKSNEDGAIERIPSEATSAEAESTSSCGICMNDRQHPAAPTSCGHVFCWGCILHWVTHVRPECPLCRSPTKPQEILALYSY